MQTSKELNKKLINNKKLRNKKFRKDTVKTVMAVANDTITIVTP